MRLKIKIEIDHKLPSEDLEFIEEMGVENARIDFAGRIEDVRNLIATELDVLPEEVVKLTLNLVEGEDA